MTRGQAREVLKELVAKIGNAIDDEEYHIDFDIDDFMSDVCVALRFAVEDMESLQKVINITNRLMNS